jgi:endonuclease YncB( thermonuclease family)
VAEVYGPYRGKVRDWHDGDTCHLDLDLGFGQALLAYNPITGKPQTSARIYGIDAPELNTEAGKTALRAAAGLCPPGTIVNVLSHGWDKYGGRFDASLMLPDGQNFATVMVNAGHAVEYFGGTKA